MDFHTQVLGSGGFAAVSADALMLVLVGDAPPAALDKATATAVADAVASGDFAFKPGKALMLHKPARMKAARLVLVHAASGSPKAVRNAVAAGLGLVKSGGSVQVALGLAGAALTAAHAEAVASAAADATYVYRHTKPSAPAAPLLKGLNLLCVVAEQDAAQQGLARGAAIAEGVALAKECANRPGNHATPSFLADEAKRLAKAWGLKAEVLDRKDCEKLGMGSFLAVAQGSDEPLKFIVLRYQGAAKKDAAPLVLVGKGITFDTGGISLKPGAEMDEMKFDMGGAASVLGTFRAVAQLKPAINLIGLIPACENMPSGRAVKPGDVVKSMSGQTIEILNTDAEGRLILCDALTYAERFKPSAVVDIATLTGACVIALGHHRSGMYASDEKLGQALFDSGEAALDPCWRMPLDEEYDEGLKSNFADMANIAGRAGGSITAAMFLKRFTSKLRWGHLDIAGTAWKSGAAKGATGRPVPLLTHFVLGQAAQA
jgi:leucyl aminopeptidase